MATQKELERLLVQLRRIEEHREAKAEKQIRKIYKELLKDVQTFLSEQYLMLAENDKLTYEILQSKGDYARFLEEVEQRLNGVSPKIAKEIREIVETTYANMYKGMVDAVEKATTSAELHTALKGLQSATPEVIKRAVENPVFGLTLNDRLERNRRDVIYNIKQQIGVGLTEGDRFTTMARRISEQLDMDYKKAVRIVRTETHRVRELGAQDSAAPIQQKLIESNSEFRLVKVWRTMGDERVRPQKRYKTKSGWKTSKSMGGPNHMKMDGQTVLMDEDFDLGGGVKATRPGSSGVAGHDINCRCKAVEKLMTDEEFFKETGRHFDENAFTLANGLESSTKSDRMASGAVAGAYNNKNDPDGSKRDAHAERYYTSLRNSKKKDIVDAIAKNTNIDNAAVSKMFDHLIVNKYHLDGGLKHFASDYDIAESLRRLREGTNIQTHDIILIYHESTEFDLMNIDGLSYEEAHKIANKTYNYQEALIRWLSQYDGR